MAAMRQTMAHWRRFARKRCEAKPMPRLPPVQSHFCLYAEGIGHAGDGRGFNDHPFNSFQVKVEFSFPYFMADILFYHQQKTIVHKMKTSAMPV
jgi:hypothetical protein